MVQFFRARARLAEKVKTKEKLMANQNVPISANRKKTPLQRVYITLAILLLLVAGLAIIAATPLAKYTTQSAYSDSARVAHFSVSATSTQTDTDFTLDADNLTKTYAFTVTNADGDKLRNEVATNYDVVLTLPADILGLTPTLTNGTSSIEGVPSSDKKTYTFKDAGTFSSDEAKVDNLVLTFTLDPNNADNGSWGGITLDAVATQQD